MKVSIVGAGPAGLYLGILLKKADPGHEISIMERNPPDATFGWGVVFSGETLGQLREADLETYVVITDTFARWDAVDVGYQGRLLRSRGHAFSAIARRQLLAILQRRCEELGVKLEFGVEIDDPATVSGDLVVAADGVNSVFRRHYADVLGSVVEPQGCKYVWFGTDLVFDAFRFIFRETTDGLFQVHAYPFDEHASTFIVECPEPTWRRSGLDAMSERESIAFCEGLFADDLDGHRLLSNRSIWLDFLLVRHTDVEAAIVDYELERQPVVERVQQAADESAAYFQRVAHHANLEPMQFAFNLLTRSGRISHASLEVRDPDFVQVLDTWFDGASRAEGRQLAVAPPPLFAPLSIGGLSVPNRTVRATDRDALGAVARGGAGLVLTGLVAVTPDGRTSPDCPMLQADEDADAWTPIVDDVHGAGAPVMLRLGHAGRRGATQPRTRGVDLPLPTGAWPLLSASPRRYGPLSPEPKAMDDEDMARVRHAFTAAASRAAIAGFDALELDMAHGYLLASFLSPLTNQRDDGYGGSVGNRLRFPLEVLEDVLTVWPDDRLLGVRLTVTDWARGGLGVDEGVEIARALTNHGAQLVHVEAGQTVAEAKPEYRRGFLTALSDRVRSEARVPTLVGGYLTTPDEVNTIVGAGRADLCLLELAETGLNRQVAP